MGFVSVETALNISDRPKRWLKTHRERVRTSFYPNITVGYERARSENLGERRDRRMTAGEPAVREPEVWTLPPGLHHGDEHGTGGAEAEDRGPPLPPGETDRERPGQHPGEGQARGSCDGQGPGQQGGQVHGQVAHHRRDGNP